MKFNTRYNPPISAGLTFDQPSMTDRSFKDECDINKIVEICMRTGFPDPPDTLQYADFSNMPGSLQEAFDMIDDAGDKFAALPSDVRKAFDNDPLQFLLSFQDPAKKDLLVAHGLIDVPATTPQVSADVSSKETVVSKEPSDKGDS